MNDERDEVLHALKRKWSSVLIIWFLISTGLMGLLLLTDKDDITATAVGPTYIASATFYTTGQTWSLNNSPYVLNATVYVQNGAKLTIDPGVVVKFNGDHSIYIGRGGYGAGDLWAVGNETHPIVFTSFKDDTEAGDTNGDGVNTGPGVSDWNNIYFYDINNNNLNKLAYCNIKYAERGVNVRDGQPPISANISYCTYGIYGYESNAQPTISKCNITNNTYGIYLDRCSGATSLQSNLIRDNGYGLVASMVPQVSGNTIANNTVWNAGESRHIPFNVCLTGTVNGDNTWYSSLSPYIVIGNIGIANSRLVTIQAGTTLKFNGNYKIHIDGKLTAVGNATHRITFTSYRLNPAKGNWDRLTFSPDQSVYDNNNKLQYCTIEYATYAIYLDSSSPNLIDNNNITNNTYGMRTYGNSNPQTVTNNNFTKNTYPVDCTAHIPSLGTNNISGNSYNNVTVAGWVTSSATWPESEGPYLVRDSISIYNNAKLTIEPGVIIKFMSGKYIYVGRSGYAGGDIWAVGTSAKPIKFTSIKDDTIGGDSNGDGGMTSPAKGDWAKIEVLGVTNSNNNKFEHCDIRYGDRGIYFRVGSILVNRCNISLNNNGIYGYDTGVQPSITNCNITNNTYGVYLDKTSAATSLQNNLIRDNDYGIACSIVPTVSGNTIVNNSKWNAVESRHIPYDVCLIGEVKGDNTWHSTLSPYIVIGDVQVSSPYHVTVQPGTTIKFDRSDYELYVYGKLTAVGNATHQITFTSNRVNPAKGDWGKIELDPVNALYDDLNKFQYCNIEYANIGLYLEDSSPNLIDHNNITNNTYGLRMDGNSNPQTVTNNIFSKNTYPVDCTAYIPTLSTNTITGNTYDNVSLGGYVTSSATWPVRESPYILRDHVYIYGTAKITLEPGVIVKAFSGKRLYVGRGGYAGGDLSAVGNSTHRIVFTSIKDDTEGGDTNGDGGNTAPQKGNWGGIYFYIVNNAVLNKLHYCSVKYANYGVEVGNIWTDLTIRYCNIMENNRGIYFGSGDMATVEYNDIRNNGYGIYFYGSTSSGHIHNNDIIGNTINGVYVRASPEINGSDNYWGSPNGPTHNNNPGGNGDTASDNLDYTPFATYYINNDRPVARAGADQTVVWSRNSTLDGRGSYDEEECPNGDANGNKLVYDWNISNTYPTNQIALTNESSPTPHFTLLTNVSGTYTFTLTVRDPGNKWAIEDTVHVYSKAPYEPAVLTINQKNREITADDTLSYNAAADDSFGNRNHTWLREWSVTDPGGSMDLSGDHNKTAVYYPHKAGIWTIYCNYSGGVANGGITTTTQVTVTFGDVDSILVGRLPENQFEIRTNEENLRIVVAGLDAKGNENTSWIPIWCVSDPEASLIADPLQPNNLLRRVFIPKNVGNWTIYANITDEFGWPKESGSVWINVTIGPIHHLDITPKDQTATAGEHINYTAVAFDEKNNTYRGDAWNPSWSTDDPKGSFQDGRYEAGQNGTWTVTCSVGGVSENTTVTVNKGALTGIEIHATNETEVFANESLQFSANGFDVMGNVILVPLSWAVTDKEAHISNSGLFTPKNIGIFRVYANYSGRDTRANWSVWTNVEVRLGRVFRIEIKTLDNIDAITVEQKLQIYAIAFDIKDNKYMSNEWTAVWQVDDPHGSVSSSGQFTPGPSSIGTWTVTCTDSGTSIFNTTSVTVNIGMLSKIVVAPGNVTVPADETYQFTATGFDTLNNSQDLTNDVDWDVTNGTIVNGLFTPFAVGEFIINASKPGRTGNARVTVIQGKLVRIGITPASTSLDVYDTKNFKGTGYDAKDNEIFNEWNWSITDPAGTIGSKGVEVTYDPGAPGDWTLTCSYGSIRANITVHVTNAITINHDPPLLLETGEKITIGATIVGYYSSIKLYYKDSEGDIYYEVKMLNKGGDWYEGDVPAAIDPGYLYYYIEVSDGYNAPTTYPALDPVEKPHTLRLVEPAGGSPPDPVSVFATDLGLGDSIRLTWTASDMAEGVTEYRIYYSHWEITNVTNYKDQSINLVGTEEVDANNTARSSYTRIVGNLVGNTTYYFAVTAVNEYGENHQQVASVKARPTKFEKREVDADLVGYKTITWTRSEDPNFDHYEIYMSTEVGFEPNETHFIRSIKDRYTTKLTIEHLLPDKKYYVTVWHIDDRGTVLFTDSGEIVTDSRASVEMGIMDYFKEYWELVVGAISVLGAAFGFLAFQRKKKKLTEYRKEINEAFMNNRKDPPTCMIKLKGIRQRLEKDVHEERLTENQYLILREKLKDYMKEMKEKDRKRKKKEKKMRMKEKGKALVVIEKKELSEDTKPSDKTKKKRHEDDGKDYHAILGVASDATEKEIRSAHKKMAEKYHPDKVRHLGKEIIEVAAKNMRELNEARDILMERLKKGDEEPKEEVEAKLSGMEEVESLPGKEITSEDRLLGQGDTPVDTGEGGEDEEAEKIEKEIPGDTAGKESGEEGVGEEKGESDEKEVVTDDASGVETKEIAAVEDEKGEALVPDEGSIPEEGDPEKGTLEKGGEEALPEETPEGPAGGEKEDTVPAFASLDEDDPVEDEDSESEPEEEDAEVWGGGGGSEDDADDDDLGKLMDSATEALEE